MRVYVAAPYARAADARRAMILLQAAGHEVARDWTAASDAYATCGSAPEEVRRDNARANLTAVVEADALLLLTYSTKVVGPAPVDGYLAKRVVKLEQDVGRGCHSELGAALAVQMGDERYRVLVCGKGRADNAFGLLAERYETMHDAVFALGIGDGPDALTAPSQLTWTELRDAVDQPPGMTMCTACGAYVADDCRAHYCAPTSDASDPRYDEPEPHWRSLAHVRSGEQVAAGASVVLRASLDAGRVDALAVARTSSPFFLVRRLILGRWVILDRVTMPSGVPGDVFVTVPATMFHGVAHDESTSLEIEVENVDSTPQRFMCRLLEKRR